MNKTIFGMLALLAGMTYGLMELMNFLANGGLK